jgi:hypothetical protein
MFNLSTDLINTEGTGDETAIYTTEKEPDGKTKNKLRGLSPQANYTD